MVMKSLHFRQKGIDDELVLLAAAHTVSRDNVHLVNKYNGRRFVAGNLKQTFNPLHRVIGIQDICTGGIKKRDAAFSGKRFCQTCFACARNSVQQDAAGSFCTFQQERIRMVDIINSNFAHRF